MLFRSPLVDGEIVALIAPPLEVGSLVAGTAGEVQPAGEQAQIEPKVAGQDILEHPLGVLRPIRDERVVQGKILRVFHEEIIGFHRADPADRVSVYFHVDRLVHEVIERDGSLAGGPADKGVVLNRTGVVLVEAVVTAPDFEREVPADRAAHVQTPSREVCLIQGILLVRRAERVIVGVEGIDRRAVGAGDRIGFRSDARTLPDAVAADVGGEDAGQDAVEVALADAAALTVRVKLTVAVIGLDPPVLPVITYVVIVLVAVTLEQPPEPATV